MLIAVPNETDSEEPRIALSPDVASKFIKLGFKVWVESGAGVDASFSDEEFLKIGASVGRDYKVIVKEVDILFRVNAPSPQQILKLKRGTILVSFMNALTDGACINACLKQNITSFALELMPRISRAQSMDILSSQSNLAGYRAVLEAATQYGGSFAMMMTAAGTIPPAKVFVMGVGVAGLQAIATAKRLGGVVTATDVRPATKEQVSSLGAKFLEVDSAVEETAQTESGYAKEMPADYLKKQKEVVAEHIKKQDIIITTALVPGRPAPTLITKAMVGNMRRGSVIIDMAVEAGGNCELSKLGKIVVTPNGVKIVGYPNFARCLPQIASDLYGKNIYNFVSPFVRAETGRIEFDWEDETIIGTLVTKDGKLVNERLKVSQNSGEKLTTRKKAKAM
tara:strand:+ start:352 stop:1536 length:1185 start_codon:yes stop_codon:yes gene_type:complete